MTYVHVVHGWIWKWGQQVGGNANWPCLGGSSGGDDLHLGFQIFPLAKNENLPAVKQCMLVQAAATSIEQDSNSRNNGSSSNSRNNGSSSNSNKDSDEILENMNEAG